VKSSAVPRKQRHRSWGYLTTKNDETGAGDDDDNDKDKDKEEKAEIVDMVDKSELPIELITIEPPKAYSHSGSSLSIDSPTSQKRASLVLTNSDSKESLCSSSGSSSSSLSFASSTPTIKPKRTKRLSLQRLNFEALELASTRASSSSSQERTLLKSSRSSDSVCSARRSHQIKNISSSCGSSPQDSPSSSACFIGEVQRTRESAAYNGDGILNVLHDSFDRLAIPFCFLCDGAASLQCEYICCIVKTGVKLNFEPPLFIYREIFLCPTCVPRLESKSNRTGVFCDICNISAQARLFYKNLV
jgi:hypothetical protein